MGSKGTARAPKGVRLINEDVLDGLAAIKNASCALVVSSPPYNIGKVYERGRRLTYEQYAEWQAKVVEAVSKKVTATGSVCWQVGNYVSDGELFPLDLLFLNLFRDQGFKLRNRVIWRFNFGLNAERRFSGRYETLLWLTRSDDYYFNLDPVRVPQLYPGKRHSKSKGEKAGKPSGNPLGKNPSDYWEFSAERDFRENPIWDLPNVKSNHPEKCDHPCQFPVELAERCILALTQREETVLDPFIGVGATAIAALKHHRRAIGIDKDATFIDTARARLKALTRGELSLRAIGTPIPRPKGTEKVARLPQEWAEGRVVRSGTGG